MNRTPSPRRQQMSYRLALLPELLGERRWSQTELMKHFGVDRKTILSDIDALSQPGHPNPVTETREGKYIYYRLSEEYHSLRLTLTESAILLLAQEAIGATGLLGRQSPFARRARSLLDKARAALPPALQARLDAMAQIYGAATAPAKDFARHGETIDQLVTAALECRTVHMRYYTIGTDTTNPRDYDPYAVYFDPDGATLKVIGWDHRRQKFIPLAIDHIKELRITKQSFTRHRFDLREHLETYCFNGIHDKPMTVRLRAYDVTARIFAERKFHRSQRKLASTPKTATAPESITIELHVARGRGLVRFILSWLPDIEVLSPETLRREIAEVLRRGGERNAAE